MHYPPSSRAWSMSCAAGATARAIFRTALGVGLCVLGALLAPTPASADVPSDYLVQMVCDNGSGGHTSADPITCPTTARKLRVGETLPYHKWDGGTSTPGNQQAQQISDSYPVADLYGRFHVMSTFYFDSLTSFEEPVFDGSDPNYQKSAYDFFNTDGNYVAASGTYDVGRGWQPFWSNSSCSTNDAWIVFPKNIVIPFTQGNTTAQLTNTSPQCPTVTSFNPAATYWNYYAGMAYESGKHLNTIKSFHFSTGSVNSDAIEMFYFTKEYGKTRWEAWVSSAKASGPNTNAVQRCPTGTNNGVSFFGSTTYYLQACHDWSFIYAAPNGDWDPAVQWHVDPLYNSVNLLSNTHMMCTGSNGKAKDCNAGGICQTIAPWGRYGTTNWLFYNYPSISGQSANCELHFSIPNPYDGSQSIYNDTTVAPPAGYTNYTYGAELQVIGAPFGGALIRVFEMDSNYTMLVYHDFTVTVTPRRTFFTGSFAKLANTAHMRLQIYPLNSGTEYNIADSWIAPKP